jgi:hypothetical protein
MTWKDCNADAPACTTSPSECVWRLKAVGLLQGPVAGVLQLYSPVSFGPEAELMGLLMAAAWKHDTGAGDATQLPPHHTEGCGGCCS